eukprot:694474-Rhodomonas_salina.1
MAASLMAMAGASSPKVAALVCESGRLTCGTGASADLVAAYPTSVPDIRSSIACVSTAQRP